MTTLVAYPRTYTEVEVREIVEHARAADAGMDMMTSLLLFVGGVVLGAVGGIWFATNLYGGH